MVNLRIGGRVKKSPAPDAGAVICEVRQAAGDTAQTHVIADPLRPRDNAVT
jgi:hypothetical protein